MSDRHTALWEVAERADDESRDVNQRRAGNKAIRALRDAVTGGAGSAELYACFEALADAYEAEAEAATARIRAWDLVLKAEPKLIKMRTQLEARHAWTLASRENAMLARAASDWRTMAGAFRDRAQREATGPPQ